MPEWMGSVIEAVAYMASGCLWGVVILRFLT
jgi:hypothetical protein